MPIKQSPAPSLPSVPLDLPVLGISHKQHPERQPFVLASLMQHHVFKVHARSKCEYFVPFFPWLSNSPLHGQSTLHSSLNLLMDI